MAFKIADRVAETTTTEGTAAFILGGALVGFRAFGDALSDQDTTIVNVVNQADKTEWEVTRVTYDSAADELARTEVLASSEGGSAVVFSAGEKVISLGPSADDVASLRAGADFTGEVAIRGEVIDLDGGGNGQIIRRISGTWQKHTLVKGDVALGSVENFGLASQSEAEAGEAHDKYMTPLRVAEAIAELGGGGGGGAGSWSLLAEEELSAQGSFDFTSLPDHRVFKVLIYGESTVSEPWIRINGDDGNNYDSFGVAYRTGSTTEAKDLQTGQNRFILNVHSVRKGLLWELIIEKLAAAERASIRSSSQYIISAGATESARNDGIGVWDNAVDLVSRIGPSSTFETGAFALIFGIRSV